MANKKMVVNSENPDGLIVDFTEEEEKEYAIQKVKYEEKVVTFKAELEKFNTDKTNANQKLKDLGLTDDEISALVG
jgi:hypothetical protein